MKGCLNCDLKHMTPIEREEAWRHMEAIIDIEMAKIEGRPYVEPPEYKPERVIVPADEGFWARNSVTGKVELIERNSDEYWAGA